MLGENQTGLISFALNRELELELSFHLQSMGFEPGGVTGTGQNRGHAGQRSGAGSPG